MTAVDFSTIPKPTFLPERSSKHSCLKKMAITLIAIAAIGLLVTGVFIILTKITSSSFMGLNALHSMAWPLGGSLIGLAIVGCLVTLKLTTNKALDLSPGELHSRNTVMRLGTTIEKPLLEYQSFDTPYKNEIERVLKELKIKGSELQKTIEKNFGDFKKVPLLTLYNEEGHRLSSIGKEAKLLLLSHAEVLSIELSQVKKFSPKQLELLHFRLHFLETHSGLEKRDSIPDGSIGYLRILAGKSLMKALTDDEYYWILAPFQVKEIIASESFNQKIAKNLFLKRNDWEEERTIKVLHALEQPLLEKQCKYFPLELLKCLETRQLLSPIFPWDKIGFNSTNIHEIFPVRFDAVDEKTKEILSSLKAKALLLLMDNLGIEHIRLFTEKQFKLKKFPWEKVLQKNVEKLFVAHNSEEKETTSKILNSMPLEVFNEVLPKLNEEQIFLMDIKRFTAKNFPWEGVLKTKDVQKIFLVDSQDNIEKTQAILTALDIAKVNNLLPHLSGMQICYFSPKQFQHL